jgi:hypothetical protein
MWVFLPSGFVSIVSHRDEPEKVLVRARHPKVLRDLFPDIEQVVLPEADYRYRVITNREEVSDILMSHIEQMDYDNFKASIDDRLFHDACLGIWRLMWDYGKLSQVEGFE